MVLIKVSFGRLTSFSNDSKYIYYLLKLFFLSEICFLTRGPLNSRAGKAIFFSLNSDPKKWDNYFEFTHPTFRSTSLKTLPGWGVINHFDEFG